MLGGRERVGSGERCLGPGGVRFGKGGERGGRGRSAKSDPQGRITRKKLRSKEYIRR